MRSNRRYRDNNQTVLEQINGNMFDISTRNEFN